MATKAPKEEPAGGEKAVPRVASVPLAVKRRKAFADALQHGGLQQLKAKFEVNELRIKREYPDGQVGRDEPTDGDKARLENLITQIKAKNFAKRIEAKPENAGAKLGAADLKARRPLADDVTFKRLPQIRPLRLKPYQHNKDE